MITDAGRRAPEPPDRRLLDAARGGDDDAFRRLIEPYERALHAHCYRMLGSLHDAEDALQDALLRAWRGLATFDAARPLRPWLYRIATNACLDQLTKRPARVTPIDRAPPSRVEQGPGQPLSEVAWLEPYPDELAGIEDEYAPPHARYEQRESIELAFVAALQHLPPRQRAVLILREVLGFSAREVAQSLGTTAAGVNSALQRARATVDERLPERSQQATLRGLGDARVRRVVEEYVRAWESRDVEAMRAMLVHDARFAMPPHPHWFHGRDTVVAFLVGTGRVPLRAITTTANGQPAVAWYLHAPDAHAFSPASLEVLTLTGDRVGEITAFVWPALFERFGLPRSLPR